MAHRIFTDSEEVTWLVLAVYPHVEERRTERERRTTDLPPGSEMRQGERRQLARRGPESGWLVFKADNGRRRLTPIVDGWDQYSEEELAELCRRASPTRRLTDPRPHS